MARKIIVYNSFVHDANPQATLLKRQLDEVNSELTKCPARDRRALINERKLIQRKLRSNDATTPKSFWSYQASEETPSLEKAISLGAISGKTTQVEWDRLSPGYKREIVRSQLKRNQQKDGVGTPEEVAYGEGWHSNYNTSPYSEPDLTAAWERGRKAAKQNSKIIGGYFKGEIRGRRFQQPAPRDFKSEKGYVAKLIDAKTGSVLARSEPHISNGEGLKRWIQAKAQELIKSGKRVKAEVAVVFFDPDLA